MNLLSERERINSVNEIRILASLNDPNIISFKEAFFEEQSSTLCVVQEFMDGGDLMGKITKAIKKNAYFDEEIIWSWII